MGQVGNPDDLCPHSGKPANECGVGDPPHTDEHNRWHLNQLVELGIAELAGMDADGNPTVRLAYAKVAKHELYTLAAKIAHQQIDMLGVIEQLDKWRNGE